MSCSPAVHDETTTTPANPPASARVSRLARLRQSVPSLMVAVTLVGLGVWGHSTGWKVPKFSALTGAVDVPTAAWCDTHNVPEAQCIQCRPGLLAPDKDYGWCSKHGVHNCPLENPQVAQRSGPAEVSPALLERADRALATLPRDENNSRCSQYTQRIQFASIAAMKKAGVDVTLVEEQPLREVIAASGEIVYDPTQVAHLSSRASGTVWRVEKQVGDKIQRGDVLALVDAAEVGQAKAALMQAIVQAELKRVELERLQRLADAVAQRQLQEARSAAHAAEVQLLSAQQTLVNLGLPVQADELQKLPAGEIARKIQFAGLPEELVARLDRATTTANLLPIRAPLDGVVVDCQVVAGEVTDVQKTLFVVANPEQLWLTLHVPQEDARYIALGQEVRFRPDGNSADAAGQISWISTAVDDRTRTVDVRANLPNSDGRLRAHTFGRGEILLREEAAAVVVPADAVHWDGSCHVVFVRDRRFFDESAPKFFHVRSVRLGARTPQGTEVIAGLLPGEVIATKGGGVLLAQLLKSNLGAGCCGDK